VLTAKIKMDRHLTLTKSSACRDDVAP